MEDKPMAQHKEQLAKAISQARRDPDMKAGLLAQRRQLSPRQWQWFVAFDDSADRFMTVIATDDVRGMTNKTIMDLILGCWDPEWDDILNDNPVGDFRIGSSDFTQRDKKKASHL
jgi:hypothetical protein